MNKKSFTNKSNQEGQYGLLSMLALIVGVVIGSGIYVVNDALYKISNSAGLIIISWLLIALIVLFMLIAFIEISSITAKKKEAGTINNWFKHLWGKKYSKYIGVFFAIVYFPVLISVLSIILGEEFFKTIWPINNATGGYDSPYLMFLFVTVVSFFAINIIFAINTYTFKPGNKIQETGTIIKLIPLILLIFLGLLILMNAFTANNDAINNGEGNFNFFDSTAAFNQGWSNNGFENFKMILLMAPTIMFSFDGFLFAASLQNESKKPSTYKVAALSGVIFIILIYILLSLFVFAFGDESGGFIVANSLYNITGQKWLSTLVGLMIVISVFTGISGNSIAQNRMIADLSVNNEIKDLNGNLIARNKAKVPQNSAKLSWILALMWLLIFRLFDLFILISIVENKDQFITFNTVNSTLFISGWSLNFITLISYTFYVLVIIGAFKNRFNHKVEVDKNKFFYPAAFISIVMISIILLVFMIDLFDYRTIFTDNNQIIISELLSYIFHIMVVVIIILIIIFLPIYLAKDVKKASKEELRKKEKLIKAYKMQKIDPRYK
ncbi:/ steT_2 / Serine/threonine exchanger SteT /:151183 Forward [Candidatus Hepatoplasma crinochetorum]|uniref:/ steT_2 / Serine/threonine exchanger SteT /:151183 Forward n=1 Tax=Candidatus Hepatoplasma crinochetorum TaxID=295596 RepID=A0A0G7ZNN6_9MOLU|nr:/ steT_2 / Serine/threonine exchanger SteT /:151183 Forward [Candidatus Hepatoplasma crinochetorum]